MWIPVDRHELDEVAWNRDAALHGALRTRREAERLGLVELRESYIVDDQLLGQELVLNNRHTSELFVPFRPHPDQWTPHHHKAAGVGRSSYASEGME